jgi:long-chain acyl-CoA synthetase
VADRLGVYAQHHSAGAGTHLVVGPLYHSGPHGSVGLLLTGSPVIVAGTFDADRVLRAIEDHRVATSVMVPTHFVRLLALPEARRREADVSSLRILAHTGSRCPIPLKQAMIDWVGPVLREAYGGGESGIIAYITSDDWLRHPGSVGRVQPPFRPLVIGDDGSPCQAGEDGVLYFVDETGRGIRYYHDPEATAAAHLEPGTFTLGDVGHVDADGYLYVTGRVTDMVISGGVNIYPAECERVLTEHPSVSEAALFGVPDDEMGERLVGLVALKHDDVTIQELLRHCRKSVAGYKVPKELRAVREVPRSPMGKVDKRAAREAYLAGRFDGDERR